MKLRRINSLLLAAVFFLLLAVTPVRAARQEEARDALREAMETEQAEIDISEYKLSREETMDLMDTMRVYNEWPWYMDYYMSSYYTDSSLVHTVEFVYHSEDEYDRMLYDRALNEILARTVYPGMSQWQMALSIHDYMAVHCAYDEELVKRDAYSFISNGMAVCEGYAAVYQDLLDMVGIESVLCHSEAMDHVWNLVKIGGQWYHVDVTWDDPVSNHHGRAMHNFFLLDDATIQDAEHEHYSWDVYETADDSETMKEAFWLGINSPICYESSTVSYFIRDDGADHWIYRRNENTGDVTQIAAYGNQFMDLGAGMYHYQHYGLSLWNGRLYYSDLDHLYSIKTDGTDLVTEYTHDAQASGTYIAGAMVDQGVAYLTFSTPDYRLTHKQVELGSGYRDHVHSYDAREVSAVGSLPDYILYMCSCGDSYTKPLDMAVPTDPPVEETAAEDTEATLPQEQEQDPKPEQEESREEGFHWIWVIIPVALVVLLMAVKIALTVAKASRPSKNMPPVYDDWVM